MRPRITSLSFVSDFLKLHGIDNYERCNVSYAPMRDQEIAQEINRLNRNPI